MSANLTNNKDKKLLTILYQPIDETNMDNEEKYFQILDSVIDGIVELRLQKYKRAMSFMQIDTFMSLILTTLQQASLEDEEAELLFGAKSLSRLLKEKSGFVIFNETQCYDKIKKLYFKYSFNEHLPEKEVFAFYNEILNRREDIFRSREKEKIKQELCLTLPLTSKKKEELNNGKLISKIYSLLKDKDYSKLGINYDDLLYQLASLRVRIKNLKEVKRLKINIDNNLFRYFEELFVGGNLTPEIICTTLNISDLRLGKKIYQKYLTFLLNFKDKVSLTPKEQKIDENDHLKLGFNYNNFVIAEDKKTLKTAQKIVLSLDETTKEEILQDPNQYYQLFCLLPFINLFPELSFDQFKTIIKTYKDVYPKLMKDHRPVTAIDTLINYANGASYEKLYYDAILGSVVCSYIPDYMRKDYVEIYFQMLNKTTSNIPLIDYTLGNYHIENSQFSNPQRLLIGRYFQKTNSCIDLYNQSGCVAYKQVLTKPNASVILIYNKNTNQFLGRILVFRADNFLVLAPYLSLKGQFQLNADDYHILRSIANQFLTEATKAKDNLTYVFTADLFFLNNGVMNLTGPKIKDKRIPNYFPHADLTEDVTLLATKNGKETFASLAKNLHYNEPTFIYSKKRKKPTNQGNLEEINRLRAIYALKNNLPFLPITDAHKVIIGEDWYIEKMPDGTIFKAIVNENANSLEELAYWERQIDGVRTTKKRG